MPTDTNTVMYNGTRYVLYMDAAVKAGWYLESTKSEDFIDYVGFTQKESNPSYGSSGTTNFDRNNRIRFYYSRNKYPILYMDGVYVNGDGIVQDEANRGKLNTSQEELYASNISAYNKGGAKYYEPAYAGYSFAGWEITGADGSSMSSAHATAAPTGNQVTIKPIFTASGTPSSEFTASDVKKLRDYLVTAGTLTSAEASRYDLDKNSRLNAADLTQMKRTLVK